eukprot:scaffold2246_cov162-Amphora_coffeaeformis.AAC.12
MYAITRYNSPWAFDPRRKWSLQTISDGPLLKRKSTAKGAPRTQIGYRFLGCEIGLRILRYESPNGGDTVNDGKQHQLAAIDIAGSINQRWGRWWTLYTFSLLIVSSTRHRNAVDVASSGLVSNVTLPPETCSTERQQDRQLLLLQNEGSLVVCSHMTVYDSVHGIGCLIASKVGWEVYAGFVVFGRLVKQSLPRNSLDFRQFVEDKDVIVTRVCLSVLDHLHTVFPKMRLFGEERAPLGGRTVTIHSVSNFLLPCGRFTNTTPDPLFSLASLALSNSVTGSRFVEALKNGGDYNTTIESSNHGSAYDRFCQWKKNRAVLMHGGVYKGDQEIDREPCISPYVASFMDLYGTKTMASTVYVLYGEFGTRKSMGTIVLLRKYYQLNKVSNTTLNGIMVLPKNRLAATWIMFKKFSRHPTWKGG